MDTMAASTNEVDSLVADLTVLDSPLRLQILEYLNDKLGEYTLNELSKIFEINPTVLQSNLRILYVARMIKNDGFRDNAKYSISKKGAELILKLKSDNATQSIISEVVE